MKKVYQVIMQDEYNNLWEVGWYYELDDAIKDLNEEVSHLTDFRFQEGDIKEYASTFSSCFDVDISDVANGRVFEEEIENLYGIMVRGFIHYLDEEVAKKLVEIQ